MLELSFEIKLTLFLNSVPTGNVKEQAFQR